MASINDPGGQKRVRAGTRTVGLRRAREAKQLRDARRRERELALEAALIDYYTWLALVEDTRERATKRAARILAEAEEAVQMPLAQAGNALRRLRDLGETREAIRELTQIRGSQLREILAKGSGSVSRDIARDPGLGDDRQSGDRTVDAVATERHGDVQQARFDDDGPAAGTDRRPDG
jgi:hypothetical protein